MSPKAELLALTRSLYLAKGKRLTVYTDSKYACLIVHCHVAIWKELGLLSTKGIPIVLDSTPQYSPSEKTLPYEKGGRDGEQGWIFVGNKLALPLAQTTAFIQQVHATLHIGPKALVQFLKPLFYHPQLSTIIESASQRGRSARRQSHRRGCRHRDEVWAEPRGRREGRARAAAAVVRRPERARCGPGPSLANFLGAEERPRGGLARHWGRKGCREAASSQHPRPRRPSSCAPRGAASGLRGGAGSAERPMSGAGEALAAPAGAGGGRLGSPALEKCNKENTEKDINQATKSYFTHGEMQEQSIWGNSSDGELIRTQPQRLPEPQTSVQEPSEEETGKIKNGGHANLSNGNGIHHGTKHSSTDHRKLSAPVSQKMHRKIQSSLSVNNDVSKKSKVNAVFSQKTGSSPEDCCVHCILACLFCEFLTLCNIVLGQASCGICTSEACCCCCGDEMGDDCNCPCDMDCGIMDACCESSDCLEICMECCGICFPS
ncbi:myoD family inhibitor domain-containing protein [Dipodomys merriami]|uniref:myoD family inhibitor domain-containing protein n=1 Tax=Dipodomys merriami TaxID=94247 RepID=UPI003855E0C3